jgi:hypothetical protein
VFTKVSEELTAFAFTEMETTYKTTQHHTPEDSPHMYPLLIVYSGTDGSRFVLNSVETQPGGREFCSIERKFRPEGFLRILCHFA